LVVGFGEWLVIEGALLAEKIDDAGVGKDAKVRAQATLALVVAVLSARVKLGDGVGDGIFNEALARDVAASVVVVAAPRDHLDGFVVKLQEPLP
jgi:hypothetical protein